jgi:hypothetical protein
VLYSFVRHEQVEGADILAGMIHGQAGHTYGVAQGDFKSDKDDSDMEVVDTDTGATVKNKKVSRGPRWSIAEDLFLCDSWKAVSLDPINGAQQSWKTYWMRIYDQFNECKIFGDYAKVVMNRNENALSHR